MGLWLLRRLGQILPTLLILSVLIFGLQQLMPGDPAVILAGEERSDPQVLAQSAPKLHLDRAAAGAVRALDRRRAARRSRLVLRIRSRCAS